MNFFKNNNKNYRQADLWLEAFAIREEQKKALQLQQITQSQEDCSVELSEIRNDEIKQHPQVIFSKADGGHNNEEASKIQQIYAELEDLPLSPIFALI